MTVWELITELSKRPAGENVGIALYLSEESTKSHVGEYYVPICGIIAEENDSVYIRADPEYSREGFRIQREDMKDVSHPAAAGPSVGWFLHCDWTDGPCKGFESPFDDDAIPHKGVAVPAIGSTLEVTHPFNGKRYLITMKVVSVCWPLEKITGYQDEGDFVYTPDVNVKVLSIKPL